jgi:hypothetical protein
MDIDVLAIAGIALLLIFRLDRLGKQIEAVRHDLMPDERRRDELLRQWSRARRAPTGRYGPWARCLSFGCTSTHRPSRQSWSLRLHR